MRDPKIDPAAGDVLCSANSTAYALVTVATPHAVECVIREEGRPDLEHVHALADWRKLAMRSVPLADKIASLEAERAAATNAHEKRMASLDASLAFLRGAL